MVMPVWKGQLAVQSRDGSAGLWHEFIPQGATPLRAAMQAVRTVSADATVLPDFMRVTRLGGFEFWRADYGQHCSMRGQPCATQYQWRTPQELSSRETWHRPHFESLPHFGVWCCNGQGAVVPLEFGLACNVSALKSSTAHSTLVRDMATTIGTDGFLSGVLESVKDPDDNFFRNCFLDVNKVLCYQRAEDVRARVCVPAVCRESVLRAAHGDSILARYPGIDHTYAAVAYAYYWPNLAADVAHFFRSCQFVRQLRVRISFAWVLIHSWQFHFNHSLAGQWILSGRCHPPRRVTYG